MAEAGYRAIAPDLRGYGGTARPQEQEAYSIYDGVGDVIGLLDALAIEDAVLVGNDWGSTLAWSAAQARPDRIRGVAAIGVPFMDPAPLPPSSFFPQNEEALFYTLYFQQQGVAEAEFEADIALTLRKILFAASFDAGPRLPGDGTPNPFSMVSRQDGLLGPLPDPAVLPSWLSEADLQNYVAAFTASGFMGPLNYYRNLDANWRLQRAFSGRRIEVPVVYMIGQQDVGLSIPGMREIIAGMRDSVPGLRRSVFIEECGHWAPQEQPEQVNDILLEFLGELTDLP
ncbi:alpha/beta fold hydrolase [Devosia albogilva]|uniref:Alpha/beta fold hydrolase n=1 Tax=Devosia albogilva TaxID=429726 RepID=A0ABW5QFV1_9HYPH